MTQTLIDHNKRPWYKIAALGLGTAALGFLGISNGLKLHTETLLLQRDGQVGQIQFAVTDLIGAMGDIRNAEMQARFDKAREGIIHHNPHALDQLARDMPLPSLGFFMRYPMTGRVFRIPQPPLPPPPFDSKETTKAVDDDVQIIVTQSDALMSHRVRGDIPQMERLDKSLSQLLLALPVQERKPVETIEEKLSDQLSRDKYLPTRNWGLW